MWSDGDALTHSGSKSEGGEVLRYKSKVEQYYLYFILKIYQRQTNISQFMFSCMSESIKKNLTNNLQFRLKLNIILY